MFVLTCPHCRAEVKAKFARAGATVTCPKCRQTYALSPEAMRTEAEAAAPASEPMALSDAPQNPPSAGDSQEEAFAVIQELADAAPAPTPTLDMFHPPKAIAPLFGRGFWRIAILIGLLAVGIAMGLFAAGHIPALRDWLWK